MHWLVPIFRLLSWEQQLLQRGFFHLQPVSFLSIIVVGCINNVILKCCVHSFDNNTAAQLLLVTLGFSRTQFCFSSSPHGCRVLSIWRSAATQPMRGTGISLNYAYEQFLVRIFRWSLALFVVWKHNTQICLKEAAEASEPLNSHFSAPQKTRLAMWKVVLSNGIKSFS